LKNLFSLSTLHPFATHVFVDGSGWGVTRKGEHAESLWGLRITAGGAEKSQQCHKHLLRHSAFFPKDFRFEHRGGKLAPSPRSHITTLGPWVVVLLNHALHDFVACMSQTCCKYFRKTFMLGKGCSRLQPESS